jgi:cell division protein FtsQ
MMKKAPRKNRKKSVTGYGRFEKVKPVLRVMAVVSVLVVLSAGFVFGYGFFICSDCLRVTDVRVEGASILSRSAIIRRAGIKPGDNILAVNLSVARRRLQAEPWIRDVRISRIFPSTIAIGIREHTPVAILDCEGGLLLNSRREIFKRVEAADPVSLPVISGVTLNDFDKTGRSTSPVLNDAFDVIENRMPDMNFEKVLADPDTGLTLYAFGSIDEVRFGFDDDNDNYLNKFRRLKYMLKYCSNRGDAGRLAAAGFEYPDRVVVRTAVGDSYAATLKGGNHEGTGYHRRS